MTPIDRFWGEYRFLSNFYPCTVIGMDQQRYPSVEHAYHAAKTDDPAWQLCIRRTPGAASAKRLGQQVPLRPDWDAVRLDVMRHLVHRKFVVGSTLAQRLIATNDAPLIEGNTWGDYFWGVCNGKGENHLGRLLMAVRQELIDVARNT